MIARAPLWALASLLAGCAAGPSLCGPRVSTDDCPRELVTRPFSEKLLCPPDRITARARPDLAYHRFFCGGAKPCDEPPPTEVAADAERLALWRRLKADAWAVYDSAVTGILEVSGCGERRFYVCKRTHIRSVAVVRCEDSGLLDLGSQEPSP